MGRHLAFSLWDQTYSSWFFPPSLLSRTVASTITSVTRKIPSIPMPITGRVVRRVEGKKPKVVLGPSSVVMKNGRSSILNIMAWILMECAILMCLDVDRIQMVLMLL